MANTAPPADDRSTSGDSGARRAPRRRAPAAADEVHPVHAIDVPGLPPAVVVEMPHARSAVVDLFVRSGSAYETRRLNGISHFLEHVVLAGTERYATRQDVQRAIDATGGVLDALTHKEMTQFSFQVVPDDVEAAIALIAEATVRPSFAAAAVESEREIVLEEMITGNYEGVRDPFTEILWGTSSLGLPIIGTRAVVEALTPDELRSYWQRSYTRHGMLLCVAGAVDPRRVERALACFAGVNEGAGAMARPEQGVRDEGPSLYLERHAGESIDACIMLRTPGWDRASARLHTALFLLTQCYQTQVYQDLIGPRLPVYYVYAGHETFITEGYLYFYLRVMRPRFFDALELVLGEIDRIREHGVSAETLAVSRRRSTLSVLAGLDDPRDVAYRIGADRLLCGRDAATSAGAELAWLERLAAVDLEEVVGDVFQERNLCVVARGPLSLWSRRRLRRRLAGWLSA